MSHQNHLKSIADLGPLGAPDENGVRLPPGFTSRIIAQSEQPVAGTDYIWHTAPDGGAAFPHDDGGWIYVSNCERKSKKGGGASAVRFDSQARIVDAYRILDGTRRNCAGGPTPWGTWLSCEEFDRGRVWECFPITRQQAIVRPALGVFKHEAVAVDPVRKQLFLTEDRSSGGFYRFTPENSGGNGALDLSAGILEIAQVIGAGKVIWHAIPDPQASDRDTRNQVRESTEFDGGEGIFYHQGTIYFATKGDDQIWAYDTEHEYITLFYERGLFGDELKGVDNITVSLAGDVLVAEEKDDMQIVAITQDRRLVPIVQLVGHDSSEVTGPAFDPSKTRLYFSSQRGTTGDSDDGVTFEVMGPFVGSR